MQMKKILLYIILLMLLAGCGIANDILNSSSTPAQPPESGANPAADTRVDETPQPTPSSISPPTSNLGVDPAQLANVAISFWHPWSGATRQVVDGLVEGFNRDNPWGINVSATAQGDFDRMYEAVAASLDSPERPDISVAYLYQALTWQATSADLLTDLTPYVNDPIWGLDPSALSDFYPVYWEHDVVDGRRYGVPAVGSGQVLYYNTALASELGFDSPPATPEEFKQQACGAAQAYLRDGDSRNDHKGGWIISTQYTAVLGWIYAFGGEVVAPDGIGYRFNTPEVEATFSFLRGLLDDGCAWLSDSQPPEADFAGRLGLFATGSVAGIPHQEDAFVRAGSQDSWSVLPFPTIASGAVLPVYAPAFQILESSPHEQLAAWLFIKYLTEPEQQAQLAQISGYFPVRASSLAHMGVLPAAHPQWKAALDLLPHARHEPSYASWRTVRWALSDAATQVFRYYFEVERTSTLVKLLEDTANDFHNK